MQKPAVAYGQKKLSLSRMRQTFCAITQNEQLMNEIFWRESISLKISKIRTRKILNIEFFCHEEYPTFLTGQLRNQMR